MADVIPPPKDEGPKTLPEHIRAARDTNATARRNSLLAIGTFLDDPDVLVRRKAIAALVEMGTDAAPVAKALEKAAKDSDEEVRVAARDLLIRLLARQLKAKEPEDRIKALYKLAASGPSANVVGEQIIEAMRDNVGAVQAAASNTLKDVNPKVHPHVSLILLGPNKRDGIVGLEGLEHEAAIAVPLLLDCNRDPALWGGAPGKAKNQYEDLFPVIAKIAPKDKRFAAAVLNQISTPNPLAYRTLRERRIAGIAQLGTIAAETSEKVKALIAALEDNQATLDVITAIESFGKDGAPALPALKSLKQSSDAAVRDAAITAIAKIESVVP